MGGAWTVVIVCGLFVGTVLTLRRVGWRPPCVNARSTPTFDGAGLALYAGVASKVTIKMPASSRPIVWRAWLTAIVAETGAWAPA
jgi:hypothetical protein